MCGISFILDKTMGQLDLRSSVKKMNDKIVHRGPDAGGVFVYKNIGLGHRRLSIIDLTGSANQPLRFNQYQLIFNGEIYNYKELREDLIAEGYTFLTNSDSEVIPAAYDFWGEDCLHKFNGMWAFVLLDTTKDEVFFSRDRYGIKPLYIYQDDKSVLLFSEIKQLLDLDWFKKELNVDTLNRFLNKQYNVNEETFFRNVYEIRAGKKGKISIKSAEINISRWYDLKKRINIEAYKSLSYNEVVEKTADLFLDSLRLRLRSDVVVGSCLSGGIDSSSIVAMIKTNGMINDDFVTITSYYDLKGYDETYYSDSLCQELGLINEKVKPDLTNIYREGLLKKINYFQDQPIPSSSHINEYEVFKRAKEKDIVVMLDGQGADEYFLGYKEFESQLIADLLKSFKLVRAFKLLKIFSKINKRSFLNEMKWFKNVIARGSSNPFGYGPSRDKDIYELSREELLITSIPYQLHSEDRNSMLSSIESRLPFLDFRLVEFVSSINPEKRMNKGIKKSILRDAACSLPRIIKERLDKLGFVAPNSVFMDGVGNEFEKVKEILEKIEGIDKNKLVSAKRDDQKFRLVSLVEWLRAFEFVD